MATKPTVFPEWDTTGVNITEPLSGEKATGWGLDSVIVSSYFNWWMAAVYAVLAYMHGARWHWWIPQVSPASSFYAQTNSGYASGGNNYDGGGTEVGCINLTLDDLLYSPIDVPAGETIWSVGCWYKGGGGVNTAVDLWKKNLTTGVVTRVQSLALPTSAGFSKVTIDLATPEVAAADTAYYVNIISILTTTYVRAVGLNRGEYNL